MRRHRPETPRLRSLLNAFVTVAVASVLSVTAHAQSLIRDAEIEDILRDFTDPILVAAKLQPEDVEIYIINSDELNAFVANGQRIHLYTGLIIESDTPSQLQGVIAHETGHITGAHAARRARDMEIAARPAYISIGLGLLAIAAGEGEAGAALLASSQQFAAMNFFIHTRVQESSADQAAVTFLTAAGISPRGLTEFFENFRYQEVLSEARRMEYFRTHPLSSDRIAALRQRGEESGLMNIPEDPARVEQLAMMRAKLIGFTQTPAHVLREYPAADDSTPALYARAISAYTLADVTAAIANIDILISREPDNPYFHELKGQILLESGSAEQAVAWIQTAKELSGGHPLIRILLAQALIARDGPGDSEAAEEELRAALRDEPDNGFAWRELARALEKQGRRSEAELATAEQAYSIGDLQRANIFSGRAMRGLTPGTPLWVRASDIQAATDPRLEENRAAYRRR